MIPNPSLDCSYVVLNFWPDFYGQIFMASSYKKKRVCVVIVEKERHSDKAHSGLR